ncbi:MAG TPA: glycosyltransferase [Burkholderiales bacterium]
MRIAFFTSAFPVRSETFVATQIAGLVDRGHSVDIYTNAVRDGAELHSDFARYGLLRRTRLRRSAYGAPLPDRLRARLRVLRACGGRHPGLVLRCLNAFRYGRRALTLDLLDLAAHFLDRPAYDIVHCHFGPNGDDAAILAELGLLRGKLVVTFHLYDVELGIRTGGRAYRRLVRAADAVHSISEFNRRWLESFGFPAARIHYQPMGVRLPPARAAKRGADDGVTVVTVARLAPVKGIDVALAAIAEVLRRRPRLRLRYRVIGGGPRAPALVRRARDLGLDGVVEFCGPLDQAAVREALGEADLFLLPSLAEALPVAIMEAMAHELPVVATDVGSVAELVQDGVTGTLVPPGDAAALARALLDLLDRPEDWPRMGAAARERIAQRHDIEKLSDRLVEHYAALLGGTPPVAGVTRFATAG